MKYLHIMSLALGVSRLTTFTFIYQDSTLHLSMMLILVLIFCSD